MKANEFDKLYETEVTEVLPVIGRAVAGAAGVAGKMAAKTVGKVANAAAKKTGNAAAAAKQGVQGVAQQGVQKATQAASAALAKELLKKGSKLPMPTANNQTKEFEIDDVKGDEVTLKNPDANLKPEEPEKVTYKKQDLDTILKGLQNSG